jgi:hypothetical protein
MTPVHIKILGSAIGAYYLNHRRTAFLVNGVLRKMVCYLSHRETGTGTRIDYINYAFIETA